MFTVSRTSGRKVYPNAGPAFAALLAVAVYAFWPSYFSQLLRGPSGYMHAHAALMLAWMLLLIAQPLLIRAGRRELHRALGRLSYLLAPLAVMSAVLLAHSRFAAMPRAEFDGNARFLYLPLIATTLFALAYGLAIASRKAPMLHARYMVCTGLTLIDPVVARILGFRFPPLPDDRLYPLIGYTVTELVLLALVLLDRRSPGRPGVYASMLATFFVAHAGFFALADSKAWLQFATWFRDLPLT